jgi:hypothetical protein
MHVPEAGHQVPAFEIDHLRVTDAFMMPPFSIAWCVAGEHEVE